MLNINSQSPDKTEKVQLLVILRARKHRLCNNLGSKLDGEDLRYIPMHWLQDDLGPELPERQLGLTESACKFPTHLTNAKASNRSVFSDKVQRSVDCSGSKGGHLRTVVKSHKGTVRGRGGFSFLDPLRKRITKLFQPTDWPAIGA